MAEVAVEVERQHPARLHARLRYCAVPDPRHDDVGRGEDRLLIDPVGQFHLGHEGEIDLVPLQSRGVVLRDEIEQLQAHRRRARGDVPHQVRNEEL